MVVPRVALCRYGRVILPNASCPPLRCAEWHASPQQAGSQTWRQHVQSVNSDGYPSQHLAQPAATLRVCKIDPERYATIALIHSSYPVRCGPPQDAKLTAVHPLIYYYHEKIRDPWGSVHA